MVLDDKTLLDEVEPRIIDIAEAGTEGFLTTAGMLYEQNVDTASIDADRHWWVQAETIVAISICISILMTNCLYPVPYSVGNSSNGI